MTRSTLFRLGRTVLWTAILAGCSDPPRPLGQPRVLLDERTIPFAPGLNDVAALDSDTLLAVGAQGTILRSSDAGRSWAPAASPCDEFPLFSVARVTANEAWAVGGVPTTGTIPWAILRSVDAGRTWTVQEVVNSSPAGSFTQIHFLGGEALVIVGATPRISGDRGSSWKALDPAPVIARAGGVAGTRLIGIDDGHRGLWSWDGERASWEAVPLSVRRSGFSLTDVSFADGREGWAVGTAADGPLLLRTDDAGKTWTTLATEGFEAGSFLSLVWFRDARLGLVGSGPSAGGGSDRLHVTQDGGRTWALAWGAREGTRLHALKPAPGGAVAVGVRDRKAFVLRILPAF